MIFSRVVIRLHSVAELTLDTANVDSIPPHPGPTSPLCLTSIAMNIGGIDSFGLVFPGSWDMFSAVGSLDPTTVPLLII